MHNLAPLTAPVGEGPLPALAADVLWALGLLAWLAVLLLPIGLMLSHWLGVYTPRRWRRPAPPTIPRTAGEVKDEIEVDWRNDNGEEKSL